ncbi:acyl dehydratase [Haematobacter missouriensis]|uniref:Acyl dehydratase n=2 Tax=Haematobacter missouriensis TaxID=366616 RepID=A0A212AKS7_9RHOB|nr:acyl dehydratase [Haematobacter missouriensis]OWJ71929.1 acyl dehydratase [Haematobacter missouriensis]OWJ82069.1 acyl dehydratase [Haematobacter missouriensis]
MEQFPPAGRSMTFRKTMTVAEQGFFTGISGNMSRAHVDRVYARDQGMSDMLVFELAAASLFTTAFGRLAGPGFRLGTIQLDFSRALPVGSSLAATATVAHGGTDGVTFDLSATVDDIEVITGKAFLVPLESADV